VIHPRNMGCATFPGLIRPLLRRKSGMIDFTKPRRPPFGLPIRKMDSTDACFARKTYPQTDHLIQWTLLTLGMPGRAYPQADRPMEWTLLTHQGGLC
jgi:hypothetical protein